MFHVGHSSGTQQLEEEQEEEEVEEAEGLRVEGRLSVLQDSTGKRDGEGEDSCTDTAHAEGGAVEERAASGAAASVPSPPAPLQPDLPPLHRLLALCGQQVRCWRPVTSSWGFYLRDLLTVREDACSCASECMPMHDADTR